VLLQTQGEKDAAKVPVIAIVTSQDKRHIVRFGAQFRVQDYQATVSALVQAGFQARASTLISA